MLKTCGFNLLTNATTAKEPKASQPNDLLMTKIFRFNAMQIKFRKYN